MENLEITGVAANDDNNKNEKEEISTDEMINQIKGNPQLYSKLKEEISKEATEGFDQLLEKAEQQGYDEIKAEDNTGDSPSQDNGIEDEKTRTHKKYKQSINLTALKDMEGTTVSGFATLAQAVIMIDNKPYDKKVLALSKERKNDFKRFIEHYAVLEVIGKRKYHIKRVYSKKQREELNELEIFPTCDKPKK